MLSKLISSLAQNSLKSILKVDDRVDKLLDKFSVEDVCPPKEELQRIIIQKNQIVTTLTTIQGVLNGLVTTGQTLEGIITGLQVGVRIIKVLPVPLPPFTPLAVTNSMADILDTLSQILKSGKGSVAMIPAVLGGIIPLIDDIISKLNQLDLALNACVVKEGLTQEDITNTLLNSGQLSTSNGEWVLVEDNKFPQIKPEGVPPTTPTPSTDINGNVWTYQIATVDDLNMSNPNTTSNEDLLARLDPKSNNPLLYRGFKLEIQYDPKNEFSFDSRRIKAQNTSKRGVILYNLPNNGYSYSSSVEVLINEAKFRIDNYLLNKPIDYKLSPNPVPPPRPGRFQDGNVPSNVSPLRRDFNL